MSKKKSNEGKVECACGNGFYPPKDWIKDGRLQESKSIGYCKHCGLCWGISVVQGNYGPMPMLKYIEFHYPIKILTSKE